MIGSGRRRAAVLAALLSTALAPAAQPRDPAGPRIEVVSAEQLIELALAQPEMVIIDSRMPTDRQIGFIEESINLPDVDTTCASLAKLVPSTGTPVAFYCNGPKCNRSAVAGQVALACGYDNSYWFRGGFEEWVAKGFPTLVD